MIGQFTVFILFFCALVTFWSGVLYALTGDRGISILFGVLIAVLILCINAYDVKISHKVQR